MARDAGEWHERREGSEVSPDAWMVPDPWARLRRLPDARGCGPPRQVRELIERLGHHLAQAEILATAEEIFADGENPTAQELDILQGELDDALEAGRGDLERGLVILWERRTGAAVERVWPAAARTCSSS